MIPTWSPQIPKWTNDTFQLLIDATPEEGVDIQVDDIITKSDNFPVEFPTETGKCKTLKNFVKPEILHRNINSTYPLLHENILELITKFILFKRYRGNCIENQFYEKMNLLDFINRLLKKRALYFGNSGKTYKLINIGFGGGDWENIGTEKEKAPLLLKDCLSYDEMKLSAFLSVSSFTHFINIGKPRKKANYSEDRSEIEDEGVIIGLIDASLDKPNVMDYQELLIDADQNTNINGYGTILKNQNIHNLFFTFYEEKCMKYKEVVKYRQKLSKTDKRYTDLKNGQIFDNFLYYKRMSFFVDTMLIEANLRAKAKNAYGYLHLVCLDSLNTSHSQEEVYLETWASRISVLGNQLHSISDICFAHANQPKCGPFKNGDLFPILHHPLNGIKIHFLKRDPNRRLVDLDKGKLLVVSYLSNANALPGNYYWYGAHMLGYSSASSTQIAELHNPHINEKVSASNLHIVTQQNGIVTFKEYREKIKLDKLQQMKK